MTMTEISGNAIKIPRNSLPIENCNGSRNLVSGVTLHANDDEVNYVVLSVQMDTIDSGSNQEPDISSSPTASVTSSIDEGIVSRPESLNGDEVPDNQHKILIRTLGRSVPLLTVPNSQQPRRSSLKGRNPRSRARSLSPNRVRFKMAHETAANTDDYNIQISTSQTTDLGDQAEVALSPCSLDSACKTQTGDKVSQNIQNGDDTKSYTGKIPVKIFIIPDEIQGESQTDYEASAQCLSCGSIDSDDSDISSTLPLNRGEVNNGYDDSDLINAGCQDIVSETRCSRK